MEKNENIGKIAISFMGKIGQLTYFREDRKVYYSKELKSTSKKVIQMNSPKIIADNIEDFETKYPNLSKYPSLWNADINNTPIENLKAFEEYAQLRYSNTPYYYRFMDTISTIFKKFSNS